MRRLLRPLLAMLLGLALLALLVLLLSPAARQLAPSWLYYDLVVRQIAPPPAGVEQYVLARGRDFCSIGRDSECGGFRLVNARRLSIPAAATATAAWCIDYVVLRRNASALTGNLIAWANIPRAMVVTEAGGGYASFQVESCRISTLDR